MRTVLGPWTPAALPFQTTIGRSYTVFVYVSARFSWVSHAARSFSRGVFLPPPLSCLWLAWPPRGAHHRHHHPTLSRRPATPTYALLGMYRPAPGETHIRLQGARYIVCGGRCGTVSLVWTLRLPDDTLSGPLLSSLLAAPRSRARTWPPPSQAFLNRVQPLYRRLPRVDGRSAGLCPCIWVPADIAGRSP